MKNRFTAVLLVCAVLALVVFQASASVSVTDSMGRTFVLPEPATKVVALTAADCEILYALGAGDTLVGRGEYCDYPAEVLNVPSVQSGYETNVEQIIALAPQAVITSTMTQTLEQVTMLESAGIAVIESVSEDIESVYRAIYSIGTLVGKDEEAKNLVTSMQNDFAALSAEACGEGKTVYFEVSPLEWGLWTAGKGTFMTEIAELLGLKNCFDDVEGWAEISEEQVLMRNPDYIVTLTVYYGEGPTPTEEILSRRGWENVTAVKNGAILNLVNDELSRPSPRLIDGAKALMELTKK